MLDRIEDRVDVFVELLIAEAEYLEALRDEPSRSASVVVECGGLQVLGAV
jgi:hypothetical protein